MRFSGFVRCCCYFSPPETCRKRNPEALSPAEMFVLTQFGRLQSQSRISLLPDRAVRCRLRLCRGSTDESPAPEPARPGTHTGTVTWDRSCSTTLHQPREGSGAFTPEIPICSTLKLFKHSAQGFLFSQSSVTHQQPKPEPQTQHDPAETAAVPDSSVSPRGGR